MTPIVLLADSQLLFWRPGGRPFIERIVEPLGPGAVDRPLSAAYLGASNGDRLEFYELFQAAFASVGIHDTCHVRSAPSAEERAYLERADLVLLAGGDAPEGFSVLHREGLVDVVRSRWASGAVLVGVSAGAMQLGKKGWGREGERCARPFDGMGLVPYLIDVHDEPDWSGLRQMVHTEGLVRGLGIPRGGGALVHPDLTVEPVRRALVEMSLEAGELRQAFLCGPDEANP